MVSAPFREEFVEIMATVSSQDNSGVSDQSIPQWKRELILRRRTLVRTLPAGNSTVRLSRPSVIAAVRQPEQGTAGENVTIKQRSIVVASNKGILDQERTDLNPRGRRSDHRGEPATAAAVTGNMRLVEHIADAGAEFVLNGVGVDNNSINVDSSSVKVCVKMGEETSAKKISSTARPVTDNNILSENNCDRSVDDAQSDSSEELEYGPGIVNKLRSKYLSMTLRESQNKGVRPSLVNLRRATSLENLLDSDDLDAGKPQIKTQPRYVKKEDASKPTVKSHKTSQHQQRYRGISRGNDSLKRARSVEALYRNELKGNIMNRCAFRHPLKSTYIDNNKTCVPVMKPLVNEDIIIVENKSKSNKTQTSENKSTVPQNQKMRTNNIAPETELPPPDVVKTTMKIFEGSPASKASTFPGRSTNSNTKGNAKATYTPKAGIDKALPKGVSKPPRKGLAPTPEVRPFSPPNRLHPPDHVCTSSIPPASPTSGTRKLKSPSPTIESKQAFFMGKDVSENDLPTPQIMLPNGKLNFGKDDPEVNSGDDDVDGAVKTVPQTVLENIRKDGLSLQFSFNKMANNEKSYLPIVKNNSPYDQVSPAEFVETSPLKTASTPHISNSQHGSAKQVGVIRPIVTTNKQQFNLTAAGREIEKNIINKEKLNEQAKNKVQIKKKTDEVIEGVNVNGKTNSEKQSIPSLLRSTKSNDQLQTSMVFNFINRKDPPPDYIPDDGLNLAPKTKYKHGEQGVLILDPSLSGDSSTDDFTIGPPSPCNVTFEGANILINGRSNLRKQPRASKLHISFNDSATTTFEYPSESSLLDNDEEYSSADSKSNNSGGLTLMSPQSPTPGVPVPLGGSSLASYTPSKVHLGSEDFQLGVTRASPVVEPAPKASESNNANAPETVEEEYLKPAEESETVAWSAETTADLLF